MPVQPKMRPMKSKKVPVPLFADDEVCTYEEVAERLKCTPRKIRRWVDDRKFPEGGVIWLPRGRLIYGWAVNEFVAARRI